MLSAYTTFTRESDRLKSSVPCGRSAKTRPGGWWTLGELQRVTGQTAPALQAVAVINLGINMPVMLEVCACCSSIVTDPDFFPQISSTKCRNFKRGTQTRSTNWRRPGTCWLSSTKSTKTTSTRSARMSRDSHSLACPQALPRLLRFVSFRESSARGKTGASYVSFWLAPGSRARCCQNEAETD